MATKKTVKGQSSDNAGVCLDAALRTSVIRKSIKRTLKTAQFETIVIEDSIEETITWRTLEDRQTKVDNWNTIQLMQFKQFHDMALEELGLSEKKAYFGKVASDSADRYKQQTVSAQSKKDKLEDLDALDSLG